MIVTDDRKELFKAIAEAQGEFTTVEKGKDNLFFHSKYAPLDSIVEMTRPILHKHGLSAMQFTDIPDNGQAIVIETIIAHESGQYISGKLRMPSSKEDPQGYGSAITYGRRYALAAALGIVSDEDIDGNQCDKGKDKKKAETSKEPPKSPPQATNVEPKDAEYQGRIRMALQTIYGTDKTAALDKVEELTSFVPKGKTESERVKGVRDFTKLAGKRLEILCHNIEKMLPAQEELPAFCTDCRTEPCQCRQPGEDD